MKKITFITLRLLLAAITITFFFTLPSCSSTKTAMLCPDLHKHKSVAFAMIKEYRNSKKVSRANHHQTTEIAGNIHNDSIPVKVLPAVESLPLKGIASVSDEVPTFAMAMEKFKNLDQDERMEAKKAIENYLVKRPVLKKMALKRFDKLDEQYPAAKESSHGGGMSVGEILSIVAIVLAFLFPPVGLILGIVALVLINNNGGADWARTLAIVAIIVGAILTIVGGAVIVVIR